MALQPLKSEASGVGDLVVRAKANFWSLRDGWHWPWGEGSSSLAARRDKATNRLMALAAGLDLRIPTGSTGDPQQFASNALYLYSTGAPGPGIGEPPLGIGVYRVQPSFIASADLFDWLAFSADVGFELGTGRGITNDLVYTLALNLTPYSNLTLSGELLGRHSFGETRTRITREGTDGTAAPDSVQIAVGVKVIPFAAYRDNPVTKYLSNLLIFADLLFAVSNTGLRDDVAATVGLEWNF